MAIEYFVEAFEVGYYLFTNDTIGDLSVASEGSYYINNKEIIVDSTGKIIKINNKITGEVNIYQECKNEFYGGDTYINRFSLKRKHSFFTTSSYQLPDETHINYALYPNVGYPTHFFNTQDNDNKETYLQVADTLGSPLNLSLINKDIKKLGKSYNNLINSISHYMFNPYLYLKAPNHNLDCMPEIATDLFNFGVVKGVMYTYYYGVPYFLVESDINLDFRDSPDKVSEFYPKQNNLSEWLQEKHVQIQQDNRYIYDTSFSKQSSEKPSLVHDSLYKGDINHGIQRSQRTIYSPESAEAESGLLNDRYLINKPLDFYDFSFKEGRLTGLEIIENNLILARFENSLKMFNAYIEIETSQGLANLSSGRVFKNKPQEFLSTPTGYIGSNETGFISTPFGHILVDSVRGQVFLLGQQGKSLKDLSMQQSRNWFRENLPFEIKKSFPEVVYNNLNGIGISLGYDNRLSTLYLTKLDYKPKGDFLDFKEGVFYKKDTTTKVKVGDPIYFIDVSWTYSFNFLKNEWISFHSFIPKGYINYPDHFDTVVGVKITSLWKHNISNKSYLTYYGKVYPFIIDIQQKPKIDNEVLKDISLYLDTIRFQNDKDYLKVHDVSFSHAVVYNEYQNSGLLELDIVDSSNLSQASDYPIKLPNKTKIKVSIKENKHTFNQFKNIAKQDGLNWLNLSNPSIKVLNHSNMRYLDNVINNDYIRGQINNIRLYSLETTSKLIFKGLKTNGRISRR